RSPVRKCRGYVLRKSKETIQTGGVQHHGIRRGLLHYRREFERQRCQIALAVKTSEHDFLFRMEFTRAAIPRSNRDTPCTPLHCVSWRTHSSCSEAHVLAFDPAATVTSTVGVCSTARRSRNQEVREMRRAACADVPPRSIATRPKPPPCINRS